MAAMNYQHMLKPMLVVAGVLLALAALGAPVGAVAGPLIFLACPLMMVFMMRGMGHGDGRSHDDHSPADRDRARAR